MVQETAGGVREAPRVGRDELNLAEFPFAMLATRPPKNGPHSLEFRDGEKEWIVTGDPRYGLPTAGDVEVYVVLMELTREQSFPVCVHFSRHDVIRRLRWDPGGQGYDRLLLSLDRLVGLTIRTQNAFWDAKQRMWVRRHAFHILEAYDVTDSRHARPDEPSLFPSWIRWSPELYHNMQAGYIKALDINLFLSLKSAVSQALYRYLDAKRYDGKPIYRIGLKKLAFEHLGLSRNYFPSDVKRKLKTAHEELIDAAVLLGVEYAPMKNGEEMVVYRFAPRAARELPPKTPAVREVPADLPPLARRLMEQGVSRKTALEFVTACREEAERQLEYLPHRDCRDRAAALVTSIREGWAAPPAWAEAERRKRQAEAAKRKCATAAELEERRLAEEADFDAWWGCLSPEIQEGYTTQAIAWLREENRVLAEFSTRHPDSPVLRASLRPLLKRASGWPHAARSGMPA
jgi:hypothetical protein